MTELDLYIDRSSIDKEAMYFLRNSETDLSKDLIKEELVKFYTYIHNESHITLNSKNLNRYRRGWMFNVEAQQ